MDNFEIGRSHKIVTAVLPQTGAAIGAGDFINAGKCHKIQCVVTLAYGADVDCVVSFLEADDVAGTNAQAVTAELEITANVDVSLTDSLTRQTPAANYTIDTGDGKSQKVTFTIYPAQLSDGKPALAVTIGNSDAANIISADYVCVPRYDDTVSLLTD